MICEQPPATSPVSVLLTSDYLANCGSMRSEWSAPTCAPRGCVGPRLSLVRQPRPWPLIGQYQAQNATINYT